jgi:hypothetical protein
MLIYSAAADTRKNFFNHPNGKKIAVAKKSISQFHFLLQILSNIFRYFQNTFSHILLEKTESEQGCQMVFFQTKNPNVGKF